MRIQPGPEQESVWDYPRPPKLVRSTRRVRVVFAGEIVADSTSAYRVLETSHPPVWYIPREDVRSEYLVSTSKHSFCEYKGSATYWNLRVGPQESKHAAWSYEAPTPAFESIRSCLAFYPSAVEACYVDDERVQPQAGDFYGGWITSEIVGPFKGGPGTWGW